MDFSLTTRNEGDVVIIETNGYLNNVGGEKIAQTCYKEIDGGKKLFLINLENSKVVNSIGVSILIEIIEKLQDVDGKLGYYNLAPIVEKTRWLWLYCLSAFISSEVGVRGFSSSNPRPDKSTKFLFLLYKKMAPFDAIIVPKVSLNIPVPTDSTRSASIKTSPNSFKDDK